MTTKGLHQPQKPVQGGAVNIPVTGEARVEQEAKIPGFEVIPENKQKYMLFMEEKVTIILQEPQNNEPRLLSIGVNGKKEYILPNKPKTLARKFVDNLLMSRATTHTQIVKKNELDGEPINKMIPNSYNRRSIQFIHDPSPKAAALWLERIAATPI